MPHERLELTKQHHLCFNCLSNKHLLPKCKSTVTCRLCNKKHHSLLHLPKFESKPVTHAGTASTGTNPELATSSTVNHDVMVTANTVAQNSIRPTVVLLSTAIIKVKNLAGQWKEIRALLDTGSEISLMTETCRKTLNLSLTSCSTTLSGISGTQVNSVKGMVECKVTSRFNNSEFTIRPLVLDTISLQLPHQRVRWNNPQELETLALADPNFNEPSSVDLLIGADLYYTLVTGRTLKLADGPHAIETRLGWVISGPIKDSTSVLNTFLVIDNDNLDSLFKKFWELEEINFSPPLTAEEALAEEEFSKGHQRDHNGRYVVPLLFQNFPPRLGNSYNSALSCYRSLRCRLLKDKVLCEEYSNFMTEYLELGHMSMTTSTSEPGYFIPHHCVLKSGEQRRKIRVVFNASKPTSNGLSLNDTLLAGPPLQANIVKIILRQRLHPILMTADIRHMFRQILVPKEHRKFQRILWDFSLSENPQVWALNTVTYGTKCAPFVALRTNRQLAHDEGAHFPRAAKVLLEDTFVDDIFTGCDTIEDATTLKSQLIKLLAKAGMELRKWASNDQSVLADLPEDHKSVDQQHKLDPDHAIKLLGLTWHHFSDSFTYHISIPMTKLTKRQILSDAARLYDPLGWLAPTTVIAKQTIQQLWKLGLDWDSPLPLEINRKWEEYKRQLSELKNIMIPRYIPSKSALLDLMGFCDASEKSYSAVLYIRSVCKSSKPRIFLILAKTKVAPLKSVSLPRLELCAALLLAKLVQFTLNTLLCEVEAVLNSRPLCPLSSDANDFDVLTPSHFLTQEPAVCFPQPDLTDPSITIINRWKLTQKLYQHFWKKWRLEYINTLQQRNKWDKPQNPLRIDQLVIIKDNLLHPLQWKLGRITEIFPGRDDVVRVARVKTAKAVFLRPVTKLAPLPLDEVPTEVE